MSTRFQDRVDDPIEADTALGWTACVRAVECAGSLHVDRFASVEDGPEVPHAVAVLVLVVGDAPAARDSSADAGASIRHATCGISSILHRLPHVPLAVDASCAARAFDVCLREGDPSIAVHAREVVLSDVVATLPGDIAGRVELQVEVTHLLLPSVLHVVAPPHASWILCVRCGCDGRGRRRGRRGGRGGGRRGGGGKPLLQANELCVCGAVSESGESILANPQLAPKEERHHKAHREQRLQAVRLHRGHEEDDQRARPRVRLVAVGMHEPQDVREGREGLQDLEGRQCAFSGGGMEIVEGEADVARRLGAAAAAAFATRHTLRLEHHVALETLVTLSRTGDVARVAVRRALHAGCAVLLRLKRVARLADIALSSARGVTALTVGAAWKARSEDERVPFLAVGADKFA